MNVRIILIVLALLHGSAVLAQVTADQGSAATGNGGPGEGGRSMNLGLWKTPDQRGVELLQSGDAERASEVFRDSRWRGISQYRNGNFTEAQKEFSQSTDLESLYNAGTAAAKAGDYQTAVEKLEQVTEADPTHQDAKHNLDISRQLLENQQQSSDRQQGDSDNEDESAQSEDNESQQADSDNGQRQDGEQQDGEQSQQGEQQSGDSQQGNDNNQDSGGELSTSAEDAKTAEAEQEQSAGDQNQAEAEQMEQEQEQAQAQAQAQRESEPGEPEDARNPAEFTAGNPMSESEQATEQWMRRIPDDPSQLLRNKIKLNHMIQHENVTDLPEPW